MAHEGISGVMEYWSVGVSSQRRPLLHYSITPTCLNRSLGAEIDNRGTVIAQSRKNLFRVLSERRWRPVDARRRAAHVDGVADQFYFAHCRMFHFGGETILAHLRIGEYFVEGINRRRRNVFLRQPAQPIFPPSTAKYRRQLFD